MSRYIDIEPYEKDGWYLQRQYDNYYGVVIETTPLISIPTTEVEPVKHGRWVAEPQSDAWEIVYCTECGEGMWNKRGDHLPNYCYNCGAKMDLDEVENG